MKKLILFIHFCFLSFVSLGQNMPTAVSAIQVNLENKILVNWTPANGTVTGHRVYYQVNGASKIDSVTVTNASSTTLSNLTTNSIYNIRVRSYLTSGGKTTYSNYTNTLQVVVASLSAPSLAATSVLNNTVTFRITDTNTYETGFEIELEENGFTKTVAISKIGSSITETVSGLKGQTTYRARVRAVRNGFNSNWSGWISFTTQLDPPASATLTTTGNCPLNVGLTWSISSKAEQIESFEVRRALANGLFTTLARVSADTRSFTDSLAKADSTYTYRIVSINASGTSNSNAVSVKVLPYTNPPVPLNVISDESKKTTTSLTINWENGIEDESCNSNIIAYTEIGVKINNGALTWVAKVPKNTTSYTLSNLNPKDVVEFHVKAVSEQQKESRIVIIKDNTAGPSATPSDLIGVAHVDALGNKVLSISWKDNSTDEDYFEIQRSTDGINYTHYARVLFNVNYLHVLDLTEGVTYFFRVRSGNWAGTSTFSNVFGPFTHWYTEAPNPPVGLEVKQVNTAVNLRWFDDSINEDNFVVEKSSDNGNSFIEMAKLGRNVTSYKDENVIAGRTYYYRVKASNALGSSPYTPVQQITVSQETQGVSFDAQIYPNPVADILQIKAVGAKANQSYHLRIFDNANRLVVEKEIKFNEDLETQIPASQLKPGLFTMSLSGNQQMVSKKLIKL